MEAVRSGSSVERRTPLAFFLVAALAFVAAFFLRPVDFLRDGAGVAPSASWTASSAA